MSSSFLTFVTLGNWLNPCFHFFTIANIQLHNYSIIKTIIEHTSLIFIKNKWDNPVNALILVSYTLLLKRLTYSMALTMAFWYFIHIMLCLFILLSSTVKLIILTIAKINVYHNFMLWKEMLTHCLQHN